MKISLVWKEVEVEGGGTMSENQTDDELKKIKRKFTKKVNRLKRVSKALQNSNKNRKQQNIDDHNFKQYVRDNHPELYWEIVEKLGRKKPFKKLEAKE